MATNNLKGKSILIVAEPSQMIDGICSRLRTQGMSIETISSGFHAVSMIEKDTLTKDLEFHLVILFENCNDMPQREIVNLIRLGTPLKMLPILCLDKGAQVEDIKLMIEEGSNDFLVDYTNFNKVLDKINSVIK